jgi:tRNA threonylcarbamoyladenosine biosynthesis protein TsaE
MISHSLTDTKKLARSLAARLSGRQEAVVLGLVGELGAGKTAFTKELLRALGATAAVISPTFVLMREYPLTKSGFKRAYHIDLYRLGPKELGVLELRKLFKEPKTVIVIEWAEKARRELPKRTAWLHFAHGKSIRERSIALRRL